MGERAVRRTEYYQQIKVKGGDTQRKVGIRLAGQDSLCLVEKMPEIAQQIFGPIFNWFKLTRGGMISFEKDGGNWYCRIMVNTVELGAGEPIRGKICSDTNWDKALHSATLSAMLAVAKAMPPRRKRRHGWDYRAK